MKIFNNFIKNVLTSFDLKNKNVFFKNIEIIQFYDMNYK